MKLKAIYWNFYFSFYPLQACSLVSHSIRWRFSTPVLDEELRYKILIKMTFNGHFKSLLPCLLRSFISDSTWIWVSLLIIILSFCKFLGSILLFDVLKVHIDVSRHRFFSFMLQPFIFAKTIKPNKTVWMSLKLCMSFYHENQASEFPFFAVLQGTTQYLDKTFKRPRLESTSAWYTWYSSCKKCFCFFF